MNAPESLGVLLATARPLVRLGLRVVLAEAVGLHLTGEATTGAETLRLCRAARPVVVLLDVGLADPSAPEVAAALREDCPPARVVALAPPGAVDAVRALVALGAAGAVGLDAEPWGIAQAVRTVGLGGTWFDRPTLAAVATVSPPGEPVLTAREREVLALLATGRGNAAIAATLYLSVRTVDFHVRNLLGKLGAHSRTEALYRARRQGLLPPEIDASAPLPDAG